jgi:hypothetical protein
MRENADKAETVEEAHRRLQHATKAYSMARAQAEEAGRAETVALHDLNTAQKAFDAAVAKVRSDYNFGDWARPKRERVDA